MAIEFDNRNLVRPIRVPVAPPPPPPPLLQRGLAIVGSGIRSLLGKRAEPYPNLPAMPVLQAGERYVEIFDLVGRYVQFKMNGKPTFRYINDAILVANSATPLSIGAVDERGKRFLPFNLTFAELNEMLLPADAKPFEAPKIGVTQIEAGSLEFCLKTLSIDKDVQQRLGFPEELLKHGPATILGVEYGAKVGRLDIAHYQYALQVQYPGSNQAVRYIPVDAEALRAFSREVRIHARESAKKPV